MRHLVRSRRLLMLFSQTCFGWELSHNYFTFPLSKRWKSNPVDCSSQKRWKRPPVDKFWGFSDNFFSTRTSKTGCGSEFFWPSDMQPLFILSTVFRTCGFGRSVSSALRQVLFSFRCHRRADTCGSDLDGFDSRLHHLWFFIFSCYLCSSKAVLIPIFLDGLDHRLFDQPIAMDFRKRHPNLGPALLPKHAGAAFILSRFFCAFSE